MIDEKDIERLKEIFVTRKECRTQTEEVDSKLSKDLVRLSVIETKIGQMSWMMKTVLAAVIAQCVAMLASILR